MSVNRTTFIFHKKWYDVLQEYPAENQLEIYNAIIVYATTGVVPEMSQINKMAFSFIRQDIDSDTKKFDEKCAALLSNKKRGRKSKKNKENLKNNEG